MKSTRLSVTDDIWDMTTEVLVLREDDWSRSVEGILKDFETNIIAAIRKVRLAALTPNYRIFR